MSDAAEPLDLDAIRAALDANAGRDGGGWDGLTRAVLAEVDRLRAEIDDAWAACGGRDLAVTAEVSFGPAGSDLAVVEPSRQRTLGDFLRSVEQGARAREQSHRAALATARRDALNDAADWLAVDVHGPFRAAADLIRARAAQEEGR